jgi:hypothetical protein
VGARSTRLLLCTTTGLSLCSFRLIPASTRGEGNSAQAIHTRGRLKLQNRQGLLSSTSGCRTASGPCRERRRGGGSSGARLLAVDRGRLCCLPRAAAAVRGRYGVRRLKPAPTSRKGAANARCARSAAFRPEMDERIASRWCATTARSGIAC